MTKYVGKISKQKRSSKSKIRKTKRSNRITAKEINLDENKFYKIILIGNKKIEINKKK